MMRIFLARMVNTVYSPKIVLAQSGNSITHLGRDLNDFFVYPKNFGELTF